MTRLSVHGIAKGGDGVARDPDGRVVFVRGALPGDVVDVRIVDKRKRHARAEIERIVEAAPERIEPPCPHLAEGCGACDLQHATLGTQRALKVQIVVDALERIGRFTSPEVTDGGGVAGFGYRTSVRCGVRQGRASFHAFHSDEQVPVPECLIAHEAVREVMAEGRFGGAHEVNIRVGARTGDRSVLVSPTADGASVPRAQMAGVDEVKRGRELYIHEEAAGRRWRVSARSFFQSSPEAAELLVAAVQRHIDPLRRGASLCDLYSGVGLFAGALDVGGQRIAVEGNASAVADANHNLADTGAEIVHASVTRWKPQPADVVVADPSRQGLGAPGADTVAATGAALAVLVSCDPAACARDARLLVERGFRFDAAVVLDLFPQTSHMEVVSRFVR